MFDAVAFSKYGGVFATLILSGFGLPIPEEIPVVTAGAMVGHLSMLAKPAAVTKVIEQAATATS